VSVTASHSTSTTLGTTPALTAPAAPTAPPVREGAPASPRPGWGRRTAVAVTGSLACLAPTVWFVAIVVQLATGTEADHRFHQVTGQGLLLCALWLAGLLPMVRAGWRGVAPSAAVVAQAGLFAGAGLAMGLLAPGAGALPVAIATVITTTLLWAALPVRPSLRGLLGHLDPVLAPVVLLTAALVTPFVAGEVELQNTSGDEHAHMAHYFDMAWLAVALVLVGALAAVAPEARRRALWTTGGLVVIGAARTAFTGEVTWSLLAMALGAVGTLAVLADRRVR
jgi:hypothetical protein